MKAEHMAILKAVEGQEMVLQGVKASGRLAGALFELTVEQRYKNPTDKNLEVVYTFPLAWGAVLLGFAAWVFGQSQAAERATPRRLGQAVAVLALAGALGLALALSGAASETLKELGDSPIYLQTGEGSIEQYTMRGFTARTAS